MARFVYSLVVARLLGADALGTYALAIAVVQIAEVAAMAGLDSALLVLFRPPAMIPCGEWRLLVRY